MANDEIIGGVGITVTGDFSDLDAQFQSAVQKAVAEGATLAEAIQSALATPDISGVTNAFAQVSESAASAGSSVKTAGQEAQQASGGFAEMAQALAGLGAALAITEGLKSFGAAALEAFGEEQQVVIGLTAMSGSAATAAAAVAELKDQANAAGISQEQLLRTAQGLAATFGPGAGLTGVMKGVEESISATGKSLSAAAQAFVQVEDSGGVTARTLKALGLTWQDLANTMGTSIAEAQAKLKKGGQDAATDIQTLLDTVKAKFAGAADAQGQSLLGMFNAFKNEISDLMQSIGSAIAPVAEEMLKFFNANILPTLQSIVAGFQALPEPIKEFGVALGIGAAALVPLVAGLGALGLAFSGLSTVAGLAGEALGSIGAAIGGVSAAMGPLLPIIAVVGGAFAAWKLDDISGELDHLGAAFRENLGSIQDILSPVTDFFKGLWSSIEAGAPEAVSALQSLWDSLKNAAGSAFSSVSDAVASMWKALGDSGAITVVQDGIEALKSSLRSLADESIDNVKSAWVELVGQFKAADIASLLTGPFGDLRNAIKGLADTLEDLGGHYKSMEDAGVKALNNLAAANDKMMRAASDAAVAQQQATDHVAAAVQSLYDKQQALNDKMSEAKQVLDKVRQAYEDGAASLQDLNRAQKDYDSAVSAADVKTQAMTASAKAAAAAQKEFAAEVKSANSDLNTINTILGNVADSYNQYVQSLTTGSKTAAQQLGEVNKAIDSLATKMLSLHDPTLLAGVQEMMSKLQDAKKTLEDFAATDAWNKLSGQIAGLAAKFPKQVGEMTGSLKDFVTQALITADTVPAAMNKVDAAGLIGKWLEAQKQLDDQTQKLGDHFQQATNKYKEGVQNEVIPITATMQERLSNIDTTFQGLAQHAAGAWQLGPVANYLNTLRDVNAAGYQSIQQQDAQNAKLAQTVEKLKSIGGAYGDILDAEAKWLQDSINLYEKTGQDANNLVLGLEKVRLEQEALKLSSHGLADEYVAMINDVLKGFDAMAGVMADAIVNGKNLGQALVGEFKKIAQSILTDLIQAAMLPLKQALLEMIGGLLPGMSGALGVVGGSLGGMNAAAGLASNGLKDLAASAEAASASISKSIAGMTPGGGGDTGAGGDTTGGDTTGGGGLGVAGSVGLISGIVAAGAAVASAVLLAHISSDTGHIEVNTRETFAQITNIWETLKSDFEQTYNRDGEMLDRLNHIMDSTAAIAAAGPGGSASGMSADAINKIAGDGDSTVTILANTYSLTQSILTAAQTSANDLNWIQTGSDNIFHELGVIADLLTSMYQVMLYGKSFSASSESAAASQRATQTMSLNSMASQGTVHTQALNSLVAQSITGNTIGRVVADNTGATADRTDAIYAPLEQQLQVEEQQLREAGDAKTQTEALRAEMSTYSQLAMLAQHQGNTTLAQEYQQAASYIAARITGLQNGFGTAMVSALEGTDMALVNASKGIEFSQLAGAQLISTTVAQGSMLVASSVSTAVANTAAASAQFASSLTSSLINIRGSLSSAGSTPLPLNSQGAQTPLSVAGPSNGLPALPMTGHMGYATGGAIQTDQTAQLHAGEVVVPAVQVASQAAQMSAQATQIQDLQAQLAGLNITLQQSLAAGDVKGSENAQGAVSDMQAKLDALTAAMQANTAATTANTSTTSTTSPTASPTGTPTAAESAMLAQSQGDQSGALASLQDQVAQSIAKIQTSASSTDPMAAMLAMQQANAQQALSAAQSGGNPQAIQAMQAQLDQINQKISATSGGGSSSGALGSLDSNGLFVPPSAADYKSASLAAEALNTTDTSTSPDLSGLSSFSGSMDSTGIIDAINAEAATLHDDLSRLSVIITSGASSIAAPQKWGAATPKSFDTGGYVTSDQMAMVHAGEFVVPPDVTGMLRSMASVPRAGYGTDPGSGGGSSGPGGGGVVVNAPITITGVTDGRQLATMLEQHLKRVLSRTGKYTK